MSLFEEPHKQSRLRMSGHDIKHREFLEEKNNSAELRVSNV